MARQDAQLARNVVLALVAHTPRHGWAIHEELAPKGDIGRAWTLSRQLVYRAIETLVDDGTATAVHCKSFTSLAWCRCLSHRWYRRQLPRASRVERQQLPLGLLHPSSPYRP